MVALAQPKGHQQDLDMGNLLKRLSQQHQRWVLIELGLPLPRLQEQCVSWQRVIRHGNPPTPKTISDGQLRMTVFCLTWDLDVKLWGHHVWQSVRCAREEDPYHGEYHWILAPNDEGPPIIVNNSGLYVTTGGIGTDGRLWVVSTTRQYVLPAGVIRLNLTSTVDTNFGLPGSKVHHSSFCTSRCTQLITLLRLQ